MRLTRRSFARASLALGCGLAASRIPYRERSARADSPEHSAVVVVFLSGGHNAIFSAAGAFLSAGSFSVASGNVVDLGDGVVVDKVFADAIGPAACQKMATIGIRHNQSGHDGAQLAYFSGRDSRSYLLRLAAEMGGDGAVKAVRAGATKPAGRHAAEKGISLQPITDMSSTIVALQGGDESEPEREASARGIAAARRFSERSVSENPGSLVTLTDGFETLGATLSKPRIPYDFASIPPAYGLSGTTVTSLPSQFAAAELMVRAGANLVVVHDDYVWDSHGDRSGNGDRRRMEQRVLPGLRTFLARTLDAPGLNVTVTIAGEFARSLPDSDHATVTCATVIGKRVKRGTTALLDAQVRLPSSTPGHDGYWAYLAALSGVESAPFGANPHALVA